MLYLLSSPFPLESRLVGGGVLWVCGKSCSSCPALRLHFASERFRLFRGHDSCQAVGHSLCKKAFRPCTVLCTVVVSTVHFASNSQTDLFVSLHQYNCTSVQGQLLVLQIILGYSILVQSQEELAALSRRSALGGWRSSTFIEMSC